MRLRITYSVLTVALLGFPSSAHAQPEPFQNQFVLTGLDLPTGMTFLPDGRLLLLLKTGTILLTDPRANQPDVVTYMTLDDVDGDLEQGLINIVLDPDFLSNGHFYLYVARRSTQRFRVSRFTHLENDGGLSSRGDPATERLLWEDNEPIGGGSHYGGALGIAADGTIYLGTGDEEDPPQAQDLTRDGGKIHRFNRDGSIPTDNPFYDGSAGLYNAQGALQSIYAYGLRNPFRGRFDSETDWFIFAEVGGNDRAEAWEDINLAVSGANYGWPACQGRCTDPAFTDPIFTYPHDGRPAAVIGGPIYRGDAFPSEYQGAYFYGDYVRGFIRYLKIDNQGAVHSDHAFAGPDSDAGLSASGLVAMEVSPDGALYYIETHVPDPRQTYVFEGTLRRIVWPETTANQAPNCEAVSFSPDRRDTPGPFTFNATVSDPEDDPLRYTWSFGDGSDDISGDVTGNTVPETTHTYTTRGSFSAQLTLADSAHEGVSCTPIIVEVGLPPDPDILAPTGDARFRAGDVIALSGQATDPEDGTLDADQLTWTVVFNHDDHLHPVLGPVTGAGPSFTVPSEGHGFSDSTAYTVFLSATDLDGITRTETRSLFPEKVDLTFSTDPPGIPIALDGIPRRGNPSFTIDQIIGHRYTLSAAPEACIDSVHYAFIEWSTGEMTPDLSYTVPDADASLGVTYLPTPGIPCSPDDSTGTDLEPGVPDAAAYTLEPAYPNPFRTGTVVHLSVAESQHVRAVLYDAVGRVVRTVYDGLLPGPHTHRFNIKGDGLSPGVYILRIEGPAFRTSRLLIRS